MWGGDAQSIAKPWQTTTGSLYSVTADTIGKQVFRNGDSAEGQCVSWKKIVDVASGRNKLFLLWSQQPPQGLFNPVLLSAVVQNDSLSFKRREQLKLAKGKRISQMQQSIFRGRRELTKHEDGEGAVLQVQMEPRPNSSWDPQSLLSLILCVLASFAYFIGQTADYSSAYNPQVGQHSWATFPL